MDNIAKANQLEQEARRLREEAHRQKQLEEHKQKEEFEKTTKIDVYVASDYAGLSVGKLSFYYGYEETFCLKHGENCDDDWCDDKEWAFVVKDNKTQLLRMPRSQVHPEKRENPEFYLLAGIGHYLKRHQLTTSKQGEEN